MKKALAVVLAIVLVLGMSTVAFAKSRTEAVEIDESNLYTYDTKSKKMSLVKSNTLAPGQTYYYWMANVDDEYAKEDFRIRTTSALENYRMSYNVPEGKKMVQSAGMTIKDCNGIDTLSGTFTKGKHAFVAITIKDDYSNKSTDVDMELKFAARGSNSVLVDAGGTESSNMSFNFTYTIGYESISAGSFTSIDPSYPLVNFDDISDSEPIELYFGDYVEFHVNAKSQSELFLKYSDDPVGTKMDLVEKYPDANIEYHIFSGTKKTFRRTGTMYIKASTIGDNKAPFIYEIDTTGKLTQAKPKYEMDEERFAIQTTSLKNYVVSDTALKTTASSSSKDEDEESNSDPGPDDETSSSSTVAPKPPVNDEPIRGDNENPATGANDFVALAMGLTVASFAAIGIAGSKRK